MKNRPLRQEIVFNRPKKYRTVRELGRGACGETLLVHDDDMDVELVVKKYCPVIDRKTDAGLYAELMERFRDEARILFQLNHPNIVRVFNYFDYTPQNTAYIVMEYISGSDVETYVKQNPLSFDFIFEKVIAGFEHLESEGILHRDIRPNNLLVTESGEPKIIDFGFGKRMDFDTELEGKSISLNWWCEKPPEFVNSIYNVQTEVYFVGKLFEHILLETSLSGSKYAPTIEKMCAPSLDRRFQSFQEIYNALNEELFEDIEFEPHEISTYRSFADQLEAVFSEINSGAAYARESSLIIEELEALRETVILEEFVPDPATVCRVFVKGGFRYFKNRTFEVELLSDFLKLLKSLTGNKREVVVANIASRLDAISRPKPRSFTQDLDDEIPF